MALQLPSLEDVLEERSDEPGEGAGGGGKHQHRRDGEAKQARVRPHRVKQASIVSWHPGTVPQGRPGGHLASSHSEPGYRPTLRRPRRAHALRPASDGQSEKHPVAVRAPWESSVSRIYLEHTVTWSPMQRRFFDQPGAQLTSRTPSDNVCRNQ